jgi:hypothetical protein
MDRDRVRAGPEDPGVLEIPTCIGFRRIPRLGVSGPFDGSASGRAGSATGIQADADPGRFGIRVRKPGRTEPGAVRDGASCVRECVRADGDTPRSCPCGPGSEETEPDTSLAAIGAGREERLRAEEVSAHTTLVVVPRTIGAVVLLTHSRILVEARVP